jgi:hypothetical protein
MDLAITMPWVFGHVMLKKPFKKSWNELKPNQVMGPKKTITKTTEIVFFIFAVIFKFKSLNHFQRLILFPFRL